MQKKSLQHKRILITGSRGFIGRHLMEYFLKEKTKILGLSRSGQSQHTKKVDLRDYHGLKEIFHDFRPDICIHLASDALVESGQNDPRNTMLNNIESTLNILELCRTMHTDRIICASTVHVYGDSPLPFRE